METQRRLPIQARRPVVNYLQLPEEVLHIIDLFLRKPHPTAVMIAAISFRRLEGPLVEEGMYLVYGRTMKFRGCNAIPFNYIMEFGECPRTCVPETERLERLKGHFLRDQRVARLAPSLAGILQDSAIEPSIHLWLDGDEERWNEFFRLYHIPAADNV